MKSLVQSEYGQADEELDYPKIVVVKVINEQKSLPPPRETHASALLLQQTLQNKQMKNETPVSVCEQNNNMMYKYLLMYKYLFIINLLTCPTIIIVIIIIRNFLKCQNSRKYPPN
jgi:hypothetical protein